MIVAADVSMMLGRMNYEVSGITPRGEDALKSIESTRPDLILMDIALKGRLDGIATAQIVHDTYRIPVVFLTANADDDTFQRAKATKPYAFLSKPFRHSELQRAIELALEMVAEEPPYQAELPDTPKEDIFLQKVREVIEAHYAAEDFGLPQLCQKIGMSRSQLFRKMKSLTDIAPSDLIRIHRLNKARTLLESGAANVAEAAWQVGFKDPSYFSKLYQEEFGVAPSATRK